MIKEKTYNYNPESGDLKAVRRGSNNYHRKTSPLEDACFELRQYPVEEASDLLKRGNFKIISEASYYQKIDKIFREDKNYLDAIRNPSQLVKRSVLNGLGVTLLLNHRSKKSHARLFDPLVYEISKIYENIEVFVYEKEDNLSMDETVSKMFLKYNRTMGRDLVRKGLKKKFLFQSLCYRLLVDSFLYGKRKYDKDIASVLGPIMNITDGVNDQKKIFNFVFNEADMKKMPLEVYKSFIDFVGWLPIERKELRK